MSRTHKNRKTRRLRRVFLTIRTVLLILLITIVLLLVGGRIMDEYLGTHIMEDFLRTIPVQEWLKLPEEVVETSQTPAVSDSLTPRPTPAVTAAPAAAATPDTPEGEAAEFASGYTFRETKSTQNIRDDLFPCDWRRWCSLELRSVYGHVLRSRCYLSLHFPAVGTRD